MQSIAEEQKLSDLKSLQFLLNLTKVKRDEVLERHNELKELCIKKKINNPIVGEELYDPLAFDYCRVP